MRARFPTESFEEYKIARQESNEYIKRRAKGILLFDSKAYKIKHDPDNKEYTVRCKGLSFRKESKDDQRIN